MLDPSNFAIMEHDFDSAMVLRAIRQDTVNDTSGQFSGPLVLF